MHCYQSGNSKSGLSDTYLV